MKLATVFLATLYAAPGWGAVIHCRTDGPRLDTLLTQSLDERAVGRESCRLAPALRGDDAALEVYVSSEFREPPQRRVPVAGLPALGFEKVAFGPTLRRLAFHVNEAGIVGWLRGPCAPPLHPAETMIRAIAPPGLVAELLSRIAATSDCPGKTDVAPTDPLWYVLSVLPVPSPTPQPRRAEPDDQRVADSGAPAADSPPEARSSDGDVSPPISEPGDADTPSECAGRPPATAACELAPPRLVARLGCPGRPLTLPRDTGALHIAAAAAGALVPASYSAVDTLRLQLPPDVTADRHGRIRRASDGRRYRVLVLASHADVGLLDLGALDRQWGAATRGTIPLAIEFAEISSDGIDLLPNGLQTFLALADLAPRNHQLPARLPERPFLREVASFLRAHPDRADIDQLLVLKDNWLVTSEGLEVLRDVLAEAPRGFRLHIVSTRTVATVSAYLAALLEETHRGRYYESARADWIDVDKLQLGAALAGRAMAAAAGPRPTQFLVPASSLAPWVGNLVSPAVLRRTRAVVEQLLCQVQSGNGDLESQFAGAEAAIQRLGLEIATPFLPRPTAAGGTHPLGLARDRLTTIEAASPGCQLVYLPDRIFEEEPPCPN